MKKRDRIPRFLTSQWLNENGACAKRRRAFSRTFPHGVRITRRLLIAWAKKHSRDYDRSPVGDNDIRWLAGCLTPAARRVYLNNRFNYKIVDYYVRMGDALWRALQVEWRVKSK